MPNIKRLFPFILLLSLIISGTVSAKAVSDEKTTYYVYLPVVYKPVPPPPPAPPDYYSTTWYITPKMISNNNMYNKGLAAAAITNPAGRQDQLLILDFGQPFSDGIQLGTILLSENGVILTSTNDIVIYTKQFITGFMAGSDGESKLELGVGTTNFNYSYYYYRVCQRYFCGTEEPYEHGKAWALMIDEIYDWVIQKGYANQVSVAGATDIELAWNTFETSRAWTHGFDDYDQGKYIFYNFGTCDGCDYNLDLNNPPDPDKDLTGDWTHEKVHYTAWRVSPVWPIPEIYSNSGVNAIQWANISKVGVDLGYQPMYFFSALTQMQACDGNSDPLCSILDNTPVQGWNQLYDAINARPETAQYTIPYMTDIDWP